MASLFEPNAYGLGEIERRSMNSYKFINAVFLVIICIFLFGCQASRDDVEVLVFKVNKNFHSNINHSIMIDPIGVDIAGGSSHMIWIQCKLKSDDVCKFLSSFKSKPTLRKVENYWKEFGDNGLDWWMGDSGGNQQAGNIIAPRSGNVIGEIYFTVSRISLDEVMLNMCISSSEKPR